MAFGLRGWWVWILYGNMWRLWRMSQRVLILRNPVQDATRHTDVRAQCWITCCKASAFDSVTERRGRPTFPIRSSSPLPFRSNFWNRVLIALSDGPFLTWNFFWKLRLLWTKLCSRQWNSNTINTRCSTEKTILVEQTCNFNSTRYQLDDELRNGELKYTSF